jgi:hypothetical protein
LIPDASYSAQKATISPPRKPENEKEYLQAGVVDCWLPTSNEKYRVINPNNRLQRKGLEAQELTRSRQLKAHR